MTTPRIPVTPAVRLLRLKQVEFKPLIYRYADHGGARQAAMALQVSAHRVVKTLVMETGDHNPLLVLMHGDRAVSTRRLARCIGSKRVTPIRPDRALHCTGYQVGGISPFGTRLAMPVYVQATLLDLPTVFINGGKRGFLLEVAPAVLLEILSAITVDVSTALQ